MKSPLEAVPGQNAAPPRRWSVRTFLVCLVLACLVPGMVGAGLLLVRDYRLSRAQLERDTVQTARALVQTLDGHLLRAVTAASALAAGAASVRQGDFALFHRQAREALTLAKLDDGISLADSSGQLLMDTRREYGQPLPGSGTPDLVRRVFETGEPVISDLLTGPAMAVAVPVRIDGRIAYALIFSLQPQHFTDMLRRQSLPPGRVAAVFDGAGVVAGRTQEPERFVGRPAPAEFIRQMKAVREGTLEMTTLEGIPIISAYSFSPATRWGVAIGIPRDALLAELMDSLAGLVLALGSLFSLGLGLAWIVGGRIAASVLALEVPAASLGSGRPAPVPPIHIREADEVARAMADAAGLLAERNQALLRQESLLEARSKALRQTTAHLTIIFEHAPAAIAVFDREMRYLAVSRRWREDYGLEGRELIGESHYAVFPDLPEAWRQAHRRGLAGEVLRAEADRFRYGDGSPQWLRWEIWPWRDEQGAVAGIVITGEDVTERKMAEDQLLASEEKYRTLFATMTEGFALGEPIYDDQGRGVDFRFLEANDAFYRESGLSPDCLGRPARSYLPRLEQSWIDIYTTVARTGEARRFEDYSADTQRHYDVYVFSPRPGRFAVLGRDITEHRRMELALQESETRLRQLIAALPGVVWTATPAGDIDFLSQQWHDYTGTPEGADLGQEALQRLHPGDREIALQAWRDALAGGAGFNVEYRLRCRDGDYRWFKSRGAPIRDEAGAVVRWLGVITDIHDLKLTQEALIASRGELLEAQRLAKVGTWSWDAETDVTTASEELLRIFGRDAIAPFPEQKGSYYLPEVWHQIDDAGRHSLASGTPFHLEVPARRADGSEIWVAVRGEAVANAGGGTPNFRGTVQDITDRKRVQREIERLNAELEGRVEERTAELLAANRELEGFTFATSHDLKGPLGRINSFSALLERNYRHCLEGDGLLFLDFIRQNATRLMQLVDDLLKHARVTREALELGPVDMGALVREVLREQAESIDERGAVIQLRFPPQEVLGDRHALNQAVSNLLENALKYAAPGRPPVIEIGGRIEGGRYQLWVQDNGIGFDMAYRDKIFEIFRRLHTYSEYSGTGIGLALVKRAMERMGGKAWAESAPGEGATFYLDLQAAAEDEPP